MLLPKRVKWRKQQKGRMKGNAGRGHTVDFGSYGLKSLDSHWITNRQIESARVALTRYMKREGKVWIRIFPDKPYTRKPLEVRMGKGKGSIAYWAAPTKPGKILFEIDGISMELAKQALDFGAGKLPIRTKFVQKTDYII